MCALRNPDFHASVSVFAPLHAPPRAPWGREVFSTYLGLDEGAWREYDASELVRRGPLPNGRPFRMEQGTADQPLELRMREGHDHGYYFVASFMEERIKHHAYALGVFNA